MNNKIIDVSDLSPQQIAIVKEIVTAFKLVAQKDNLPQPAIKTEEKIDPSSNLAERIKRRFSNLKRIDFPHISRDNMRHPPQFDWRT